MTTTYTIYLNGIESHVSNRSTDRDALQRRADSWNAANVESYGQPMTSAFEYHVAPVVGGVQDAHDHERTPTMIHPPCCPVCGRRFLSNGEHPKEDDELIYCIGME